MKKAEKTELDTIQAQLEAIKSKAAAKKASANEAVALIMAKEELAYFTMCEEKGLEPGRDVSIIFASNTGRALIVRRPTSLVFKAYQKVSRGIMAAALAGTSAKEDVDPDYNLVKSCLVYPSVQDLTEIREETPAILSYASSAIQRMAGEVVGEVEKE